jgi:hypothetical protein
MATGREDAIRILEDGHVRLWSTIGHLPQDQVTRPATLGGGDWSVQDLIGHVAAWEGRALDALERWRDGRTVETLAGAQAIDAFNARHVQAERGRSVADVDADARSTHERLIGQIRSLSDGDWRTPVSMSNGRRHRLGTLLGGITGGPGGDFRHAWAHLPDVEAFAASLAR